jgi:hypothetical protein
MLKPCRGKLFRRAGEFIGWSRGFGEAAEAAAAVEEVVDELAAGGLFLVSGEKPGALITLTLGEGRR